MPDELIQRITGIVFPVGDGAVGKSTLVLQLNRKASTLPKVSKTRNMEFEFAYDEVLAGDSQFQITQQYFVPPGQKAIEGDRTGRSYEKVLSIYKFMLRRVDVVLLMYSLTSAETFFGLDFWAEKVQELINPQTEFILVGTHMDRQEHREVSDKMIVNGVQFLYTLICRLNPSWKGSCTAIEVSNLNGINLDLLKKNVSYGILRARRSHPLQVLYNLDQCKVQSPHER